MFPKTYLGFLVAVICGSMLSLMEVDAQSTVDDSASCESSTFDKDFNLLREDLNDVKNLLKSNQQQNNASSLSKKDLEDLKAACTSNQQHCPPTEPSSLKQALVSSFLCEYKTRVIDDF